jgi:hypothetical protein
MVKDFDVKKGVRKIFKLIEEERKIIRMKDIKLMGLFISSRKKKRKYDVMRKKKI